MEHRILKPGKRGYPRRLIERLGDAAPVLHGHGPLKLLDRFTLAVAASDEIPGRAMLATNDLLFTIRDYALNYSGGWHSVMETEIFRLALYRRNDPRGLRSLTLGSARGLDHESWDRILADRFGEKGPFTGFPEKEEYYRRARDGEILVLSAADPSAEKFTLESILTRNWVACLLADVIFIPFAARGTKTYTLCERVLTTGIPIFTSDCPENADLFALGIQAYRRRDVGRFLEQIGASTTGEPVFPKAAAPPPAPILAASTEPPKQASLWGEEAPATP
ncbi:MAG: hypothetical protein QME96_08765, partial [Myxococcota bacterium]|nr:hypothetical protein [Myxococcota bacterium]